jgi:hypothetical protein
MGNGSSPVNRDLDGLHDMLFALNEQLSKSLDTIDDPALAQAVVTEMREVVHRIDLVQSLLFTAASREISDAVAQVNAANAKLVASLQVIKNITSLVRTVGDFLTLVDGAIDLAKTL